MSFDSRNIISAWRGHERFAHWLVQTMDPVKVVELGVDFGYSLIELARYNLGVTVGIDWFEGDSQTGSRNTEQIARQNVIDSGVQRVEVLKSKFDEALDRFKDSSIDILHIDGLHTYEASKHDLETWWTKVRVGGVVLMHDTESFPDDVGRVYHEIQWPKFNFTHSSGLGVITKLA